MKTMKVYNVPETEVMELLGERMMGDLAGSITDNGPSGECDAPMRVGSLGPSY